MWLTTVIEMRRETRRLFESLIQAAIDARQHAYAPYSRFAVGAAVLGSDGMIYRGCNVENASYGLTVCAERNAVGMMIASGCREISAVAIALVGSGGSPCGACRQVLAEFGHEFPILIVDADCNAVVTRTTIEKILPMAFRLKQP